MPGSECFRERRESSGQRFRRRQRMERTGITMDGKAVFQFAVRKVPEVIREVLDANGLSADDIDWFILHQANRRIVESVAKRLKTDIERFPMNLQEYGNTSSASIPILLNEMNREGLLKKGQKLVMAGFGAGLSWEPPCWNGEYDPAENLQLITKLKYIIKSKKEKNHVRKSN